MGAPPASHAQPKIPARHVELLEDGHKVGWLDGWMAWDRIGQNGGSLATNHRFLQQLALCSCGLDGSST